MDQFRVDGVLSDMYPLFMMLTTDFVVDTERMYKNGMEWNAILDLPIVPVKLHLHILLIYNLHRTILQSSFG